MSRRVIVLIVVLCMMMGFSFGVGIRSTNAAASIQGLHVSGNQILNGAGQIIHLYGVNRSGAEYACEQGWGIWDGPADAPSVAAIASWNVNIVRIPVNEDCWLGINGVPAAYAGSNYQQAVISYVTLLNSNGIAAIIDLQFNAPGSTLAADLNPMPDADHSPAFWQSVATTFKGNTAVLFDLLNEPFPDNNQDTTAAWTCWKNGGTCSGVSYQVAGMQQLVTTIRNTGAANIIMAGGVEYSNSLTQWLTYRPSDPTGNLVASWHVYDFTGCTTSSCWDGTIAPVMAQVPVITGEIGETDCGHGFIDPLMTWLDAHGGNYLGWAWDAWPDSCASGPVLITDYNGTPTNYGIGLKNHLASLATLPTSTTAPSATFTPSRTPTRTPTKTNTPTATLTKTPTLVPSPTVAPGSVTVDDNVMGAGQNQFNYVGAGWSHCTACNEPAPAIYYNASQSWDDTTNEYVTLSFTGTQVRYYAILGPWHGIAEVSIDGTVLGNVDLYGANKTGNALVWASPVLPYGSHTLKIRDTGTKDATSTGTVITLDRVDIVTTPPTTAPTNTFVPPTKTVLPPTATTIPATTIVPPTQTVLPTFAPTNTSTNTPVPPTKTATPLPTNTPIPPTKTPMPPTATTIPSNTPIPPTKTPTPLPSNTPTVSVTISVDDSVMGGGQNQFNYVGTGWSHCTACNEPAPAVFYNASQSWDDTANEYVTLSFTGTRVSYYAILGPWHGIAEVSIDGTVLGNVDLYGANKTGNTLVWTSPALLYGTHTLKIRDTGTKDATSTGTVITLDRVDVTN